MKGGRHLVYVADGLVVLAVALAAFIALSGGVRIGQAPYRLSLTDPIRPLALAAVIALARHARWRRPSILDRVRGWIAAPLESAPAPGADLSTPTRPFVLLPVVMLAAAAAWMVFQSPGTDDVRSYWLPWMHNIEVLGVVKGYAASQSDYPPGTAIILAATATIGHAAGVSNFIALKTALLVCLWLTSFLFWLWTRRLSLTVALYGVLLLSSLALGYVDVFVSPFFVGALWALEARRPAAFGVLFTLSWLVKWQPLLVAPFLALHLAGISHPREWRRLRWRHMAAAAVPALFFFGAALARFGAPFLQAFASATSHPYLSGNALNFCWIITHWVRVHTPDAFGPLVNGLAAFIETTDARYVLVPKLLFWAFYTGALVVAFLRPKTYPNLLRFALLGYLAYVTFNTGVHENHLFLAVIMAMLLAWQDRTHIGTAIAVTAFFAINLILFFGVSGSGLPYGRRTWGVDVALPLSIAVVVFFLVLCVRETRPQPSTRL